MYYNNSTEEKNKKKSMIVSDKSIVVSKVRDWPARAAWAEAEQRWNIFKGKHHRFSIFQYVLPST